MGTRLEATAGAETARIAAAALDRAIRALSAQTEQARPRPIRTAFWPSDLLTCRRRTGLGFLEVERDQPDPRVLESRTWGELYHTEYYRRLQALEPYGFRLVATEQPVSITIPGVDLPLRGRYDALVEASGEALASFTNGLLPPGLSPKDHIRFLVDIKAVTSYTAREAAATGRPTLQDAAEMTCYLHHTGLPFGIVIYHDRQSSIREPLPVLYDPDFFSTIQDWIRDVYAHIRAGRVPPRDHDPETTDFPCAYCQFRTACIRIGPSDGTSQAPPEQLLLHQLTDEAQLAARGRELLDRIIQTEAQAREVLSSTIPLRQELEAIVRRIGRVDTELGSASISTSTEWDLDTLRIRLAELGKLEDAMEISTARVRKLIDSGHLPASLLSDARRTTDGVLRITPARRRPEDGNGARSN